MKCKCGAEFEPMYRKFKQKKKFTLKKITI